MRYAIGLPTVGEFGDPRVLADLATLAAGNGWSGVQLWDHVLYHEPGWAVASPTVVAGAVAAATDLHIMLTVALPRRQVQDVARDTATLASLARGGVTLVATIGSMDSEYANFGLDASLPGRGARLDDGLARLTRLWDEWGVPRLPIWCGGRWPRKVGLRRAARWQGAMPTFDDQRERNPDPEAVRAAAALVPGLDLAIEGVSPTPLLPSYADAGVTWWIEAFGWWRGGVEAARARILAGPPSP
ncbi:LLM class flavin-dependent oxidoreductase [Hamadaea tsunoensis]|uniref:LLM class flavin-dependent oxidoreductase n=1 Tax=Hamadaea tsunoensis TaxID=53368 RepID=UPI000552EABA|nr:LLM class flavin-dependent oxidoreductase [Hamadaea tsunoensis]